MDRNYMRRIRLVVMGPSHSFYLLAKLTFGVLFAYSTNFVPDEFWQSTEVAYVHSFGKGHLTWEWKTGIRSYIIPAIISAIYEIPKLLNLPITPAYLMLIPQFLQGLLTMYAIMMYFQFGVCRFGLRVGNVAYLIMLMNWFTSYCAARTISNTTEMSLNIFGLWFLQQRNYASFMLILMVNFFIRPTAAIFWIAFLPEFLMKFKPGEIFVSAFIGLITAVYLFGLDVLMYGKFILTPWEFFKFNFLTDGNEEFGVHHFMWYFYSGLPSILGPLVITLPFGFFIPGDTRKFSFYTLFYLAVFSYIGHKEIRFLLPVLPLVFIIVSSVLWEIINWCERRDLLHSARQRRLVAKNFVTWFAALNIVVALFLGIFHQRGFRAVGARIHPDLYKMTSDAPEFWVLTPCYSMAVHTYLHHPKTNFVYYICPPSQFEHLYDTSGESHLILQQPEFTAFNLVRDVTRKVLSRGVPDWFITYKHYGHIVLKAIGKQAPNVTYFPKDNALHTPLGRIDNRVILFQRVE